MFLYHVLYIPITDITPVVKISIQNVHNMWFCVSNNYVSSILQNLLFIDLVY